jgi:hypothetical protein
MEKNQQTDEKQPLNIKTPYWFNPKYPILSEEDEVGKAALEEQVFTYPQVVRQNVDPAIIGQQFSSLSFNLFKEPVDYKGKKIFGFVKSRGNSESKEVAINNANKIVLNIDSKFQVRICHTGEWVPITESDSVVKELYDVRGDKDEKHLRDQAIKEKNEDDARKMKEIREGEKNLKEGGDIYDDPTSINFYVMKRVTEMKLYETLQIHLAKMEEMRKKLGEQRIILKELEIDSPEYKKQWLGVYNESRTKISLPKLIPGEHQFDDYESETLDVLLSKYPRPRPEATGRDSGRQNNAVEDDDGTQDKVTAGRGVISAKSYSLTLEENEEERRKIKTMSNVISKTDTTTSISTNTF